MSTRRKPGPGFEPLGTCLRVFSVGGLLRLRALAALTFREALRSRVLLGMTALMCVFAFGSLLLPADLDRERVILVQHRCFFALTFFGLIAAAFLGGSLIPKEISTKRVYAIATKPISRLEQLLGRTLGVVWVMAAFLLLGGVITYVATHAASRRTTFEGGSYVLEVTSPTALVRTKQKDDHGNPVKIEVKQGQELFADGRTEDGYKVTIASRDMGTSGVIAAKDVKLHVRSLAVQRIVEPTSVTARAQGVARADGGELLLLASSLAPGDVWEFDLTKADVPSTAAEVHVRFQFQKLIYEPPPRRFESREPPLVSLTLRNPATGEELTRDVQFTFSRRQNDKGGWTRFYQEVLALPRPLLTAGRLEARVNGFTPRYDPTGQLFYTRHKSPTWRISGFDAGDLREGRQTLRARFLVHAGTGMDLVDHAEVGLTLRNPATGRTLPLRVDLRNKTTSHIHFDRSLLEGVDPDKGIEVTLQIEKRTDRIGHYSKTMPFHLVLAPGRFWASTARSLFLIFLLVSVFAVVAVAASTILSAPIAILLTLVVVLGGLVKELVVAARGSAEFAFPGNPFRLAAEGVMTLQEAVFEWVRVLMLKTLDWMAPGFDLYSSTEYVNRGWSVPWSAVSHATVYSLLYAALVFVAGYVLFRRREFE